MLQVGTYLRGSWKDKPQAWGNFSDVQAGLFHNAEKMGVNPADIVLALPMWNPGNQVNYGSIPIIGDNKGASYVQNKLNFNGTTNYIDYGTSLLNNDNQDFTVLVRAKRETVYYKGVISKDSPTARNWFLAGLLLSEIRIRIYEDDDSQYQYDSTDQPWPKNTWTQLGFVVDVSNSALHRVVNGESTDITGTWDGTSRNSNTQCWVGGTLSTSYLFDGQIDYTYIFSTALTEAKIAELSDNPYQLWQPYTPPIYIDLGSGGGETLLPIDGNLPAMNGALTKQISYHRSIGGSI